MGEVPAKFVGTVVLVAGAIVALAAGVLLPVMGGGFWAGAPSAASSSQTPRQADASRKSKAANEPSIAESSSPAASRGSSAVGPTAPRSVTAATRLRAPQALGAAAAAARMPASADMVLVVENAATWRTTAFGDAAVRFLLDASATTPTQQAWTSLAQQLGWSESETFDRLLGRRVVLVARGFGNTDSARWALLSDVSLDTDQRLKTRLAAAQRSIDQGHQILSIEKGKYELTSHRRTLKPEAESGDDEVTIVLGPAGKSELFDEIVGVLARGADDALLNHEVMQLAADAGASEILLLARLGEDVAPGADRWNDFFLLSGGRPAATAPARPSDQFAARVVYRDRGRRESNLKIAPSSGAVFRALAPGSLLTIVQAAPVQQILGDAARVLDTLRDLPLPEPARALVGSRQVLSLREVAPLNTNPRDGSGGAGGLGGERRPLVASLGVETVSTRELAPILDGSISRFVAAQEQIMGTSRPPPHDFGGALPGVTRILPMDLPDGHPLRLFVTDDLTLTWSFPSTCEGSNARGASTSALGGWWVMSLTPSSGRTDGVPEAAHNQVSSLISHAELTPPDQQRRWIWLASARPALIERRLPGLLLVPDVGGFRSAMRRFEELVVELSINDAGDIQGDVNARLAPVVSPAD